MKVVKIIYIYSFFSFDCFEDCDVKVCFYYWGYFGVFDKNFIFVFLWFLCVCFVINLLGCYKIIYRYVISGLFFRYR